MTAGAGAEDLQMHVMGHQTEASVHSIITDAELGDDGLFRGRCSKRHGDIPRRWLDRLGQRLWFVVVRTHLLFGQLVGLALVHLIVEALLGPGQLQPDGDNFVVRSGVADTVGEALEGDLGGLGTAHLEASQDRLKDDAGNESGEWPSSP
jgi:hypothetical protein